MTAVPLFATPRDPARPTDGAQVGVIARALGTPLIPWQDLVAQVSGERREDGSYEYQVVVVSVPRQCGKTTLLRAVGTHRALVHGRDVFYTAQTGKDARERWLDLVKVLRVNPALKDRVTIGLRGGSEQVLFRDSGAAFRCFAPTVESLHGYTPPTVMLDEVFALTGMTGDLLMGAIGPAQITVIDRQVWIVSTAGTAASVFLHDWIDRALEGTPRVAGFYWGARPDQDPYDPVVVEQFHPGVGHVLNGKRLTGRDVVDQAATLSRAEYERAYANRRTVTRSHLIPAEAWDALGCDQERPDLSGVVLAYDVAADRQSSCILAAWVDDVGRHQLRVVTSRPGVAWLDGEVDRLAREWRPRDLVAVDHGPVLEVTARVRELGHAPTVLGEREFATACGAFLSWVDDQAIGHDRSDVLATSVAGLVTRPAAVDGVAFSRRHSVGDSSPGIAAAAGAWVAARSQGGPVVVRFA